MSPAMAVEVLMLVAGAVALVLVLFFIAAYLADRYWYAPRRRNRR